MKTYINEIENDLPDLHDIYLAKRMLKVLAKDCDKWFDALCFMRFLFIAQFALWIVWL